MKPNDCKPNCDFTKALYPRRATWVCAKCGRDFSMEYLFWAQSEYPKLFERKQNESTQTDMAVPATYGADTVDQETDTRVSEETTR